MNIKLFTLLLIPITIGVEIQAAVKSETITVTNKTGSSIWVSTQYNLKNAVEIKSEENKDITLDKPGTFAYIANQKLPFETCSCTTLQEIPFETDCCTTLAITYFNKSNTTFYAYAQRFSINDTFLGTNGPGVLHPAPYNKIQGTSVYIYNNPYSSVKLTATNSSINPFVKTA